MAKKQIRGKCAYCGREMTNGGMRRHFSACKARQEVLEITASSSRKPEPLYHLQVQDRWNKDYWLHLEVRGSATLEDLDNYLRAIWLECCGHLSMFSTGGWDRELNMKDTIKKTFQYNKELLHIYDFGTSSYTEIRLVDTRQGYPTTDHPIALMARNNAPDYPCMECGKRAGWVCTECMSEYGESGLLCDKHVEEHPHEDYGEPVELYNSPRMGMCSYDGPAEPPY